MRPMKPSVGDGFILQVSNLHKILSAYLSFKKLPRNKDSIDLLGIYTDFCIYSHHLLFLGENQITSLLSPSQSALDFHLKCTLNSQHIQDLVFNLYYNESSPKFQ
jgi:hypothetical protein